VVYDKFHATQNVVEACDQIRKGETRSYAGQLNLLERARWMWLKIRVNSPEKELKKWESKALDRCVTGMASKIRLGLKGIYAWKDAGKAAKPFRNSCAWVQAMQWQV
jgi:hypothetical protein